MLGLEDQLERHPVLPHRQARPVAVEALKKLTSVEKRCLAPLEHERRSAFRFSSLVNHGILYPLPEDVRLELVEQQTAALGAWFLGIRLASRSPCCPKPAYHDDGKLHPSFPELRILRAFPRASRPFTLLPSYPGVHGGG